VKIKDTEKKGRREKEKTKKTPYAKTREKKKQRFHQEGGQKQQQKE